MRLVAKPGIPFILAGLIATAIAGFLNGWLAVAFGVLTCFVFWFFRDPERPIPTGAGLIVAPADGKIVQIREEQEERFLHGRAIRISIFLNIFDVHVNRTPIAGVITEVQYKRGKFLVASREAASAENEQNTVSVDGDGTRAVFKQIAGLIARRIVFNKKPGDHVALGERVGLIKFGSRVDVELGPDWEIVVQPGVHVSAGSSVIARRIPTDIPAPAGGERRWLN